MKIVPVILAGGSGLRLWPFSRQDYPKQFFNLIDTNSILQNTLERLSHLNVDDSYIICGERHRFHVQEQIANLKNKPNIVLETASKNTAPAIALAAFMTHPDDILIVLPSDHFIGDKSKFEKSLNLSIEAANHGYLATFGILPTAPNINYGYIKVGNKNSYGYEIEKFIEKPSQDKAKEFFDSKKYFWNSGMFTFRAGDFLNELSKLSPEIFNETKIAIDESVTKNGFIEIGKNFKDNCPSDSIDYAIMETTEKAMMVPFDANWSDIGSWSSLHQTLNKDRNGNHFQGNIVDIQSSNSMAISSDDRLIALLGVKDTYVIDTKDAILVADKSKLDDMKSLVENIKEKGYLHHEIHREVRRPWGKYDSVDNGDQFQVKRITVKVGAKLSVQSHKYRSEHWVVVNGKAEVTIDDEVIELNVNESTFIPLGAVHSLKNIGDVPLELIEVQIGSYLGEDDIERFEDIYGRT